jgi:CDP-paratose 2-epimerase
MYERILVTGGAGFVGSALALHFRREFPGARITAFDNLRRRGSELNLARLARAGVEFLHGDVRSPQDLAAAPAPQLIVEASAEPSAQAGYGGSPGYLIETNLSGCFHCLELARRSGADFLFLSTSRVYPVRRLNELAFREDATRFTLLDGQAAPGASAAGVSEDFPLEGARSLYGMTKLAAELMIAEYAGAYGLRCAVNRCGVIAGPGQMGRTDQGVATLWVAAHHFRRPLSYIGFGGAGKQVRDILHIDDLCELLATQARCFERWAGRTFNVGGGLENSLSLREMTALCEEITGNRIPIEPSLEDRPADIRIYLTDHARLTEFSGWRPSRGPRAVLAGIHEWIRGDEDALRPVLSGR